MLDQKKLKIFLLKGAGLYLLWEIVYQGVIVPRTLADEWFIHFQTLSAAWILDFVGFDVYTGSNFHTPLQDLLWIDGSEHSLWVMHGCDAMSLLALCSIFILAFPATLKQRLWLFPYLFAIMLANIIRICCLVYLEYRNPALLEFNHKYTFTALMYLMILYFWYRWLRPYRQEKAESLQ